jgi:hypothetical protein
MKLIMANKILEMEKLATPFGHVHVETKKAEPFLTCNCCLMMFVESLIGLSFS